MLQGQVKVKKSLNGNINDTPGLDGFVNVSASRTTGVVDNLETADPKKALSANQGVVLKGMVDSLEEAVQGIIDEMNYKNIDITGFSCPGAGTYEMGRSVAAPTVSWSLNKTPASQSLNGEALGVDVRSKAYSGNITSNKTYTLNVTGQKGEKDSASGSFTFYNGVYYGVLENGAAINSAAVLTLTRKLQGSKAITFTADAGATQRIAYAFPTRYSGEPVFNVGGFEGGFSLAATFQFTNASGYTETYDVYLSDNVNLGSTTVKVS